MLALQDELQRRRNNNENNIIIKYVKGIHIIVNNSIIQKTYRNL